MSRASRSGPVLKRSLKRAFALMVLLAVSAILLFRVMWRPRVTMAIKDSKFEVISAEVTRGNTHRLYMNSWPVGQILDLLSRAGVLRGNDAQGIRMPEVTYTLRARFTGAFVPNELSSVRTLAVDGTNGPVPLRVLAGYNSGSTPSEYGGLWLLGPKLTNSVTIVLAKPGQPPLAEVRIAGQ